MLVKGSHTVLSFAKISKIFALQKFPHNTIYTVLYCLQPIDHLAAELGQVSVTCFVLPMAIVQLY